MCQTRDGQAKGERNMHHSGWIVSRPGDAGRATDQNQKKRSKSLGEQHDQELDLRHLFEADEVFCTCTKKKKKVTQTFGNDKNDISLFSLNESWHVSIRDDIPPIEVNGDDKLFFVEMNFNPETLLLFSFFSRVERLRHRSQ